MNSSYNYVRHGMGCVRPYLYGHPDLPEFVQRAFGAQELERIQMGDGVHVEARIGDSVIVIETHALPPELRPAKAAVCMYVEDVDATYRHALDCGATSVAEPADMANHERQAAVMDSFGNIWWIATCLARARRL